MLRQFTSSTAHLVTQMKNSTNNVTFGLPLLSTVSGKNDLADLFNAGFFP